jgi:uroporphyrinogen decarboxylase
MTNKRERLEQTLMGEKADRIPVAIWRYFPSDDQRSADFANAIVNYQTLYDWDYVLMPTPISTSITGYGVTSIWQGNIHGQRDVVRTPIRRSLDWTDLRTLDPNRGEMAKQLECLSMLCDLYTPQNTPVIPIVYSPLTQATALASEATVVQHLRTHPDRLRTGLNTITESTLRYVEMLRKYPIAGIMYVVSMADYQKLTPEEYSQFGKPYDDKIMDIQAQSWWLNVLQLRGKAPMMPLFADYPVQVVNWDDQNTSIDLSKGFDMLKQVLQGGLDAHEHFVLGTPADIRTTARKAMQATLEQRLILGSQLVPIITPMSHLSAVRDIV